MAIITPGIIFLSRAFVSLLLLCAVIGLAGFVLDDYFGIFVSRWILIVATVLVIPVIATLHSSWALVKKHRRAAALGARVAPTINGSWPGNLDVLLELVKNVRHGYPGK
jgi:hypothetical protein